jgi:four helix bundle protein
METPSTNLESDNWESLKPVGLDSALAEEGVSLKEDVEPYGQRRPFDLEERTTRFGVAIVQFSKRVPHSPTNNRLIDQLVGSATSVGANYMEASERVSKKDFVNTVSRCVKEAKEARFFLRMIAASEPELAADARILYREASELLLILATIRRKAQSNP